MKRFLWVVATAAVLSPVQGHAQAGIAVHAGTLGVGADIATTFGRRVGLRSGFSFFPMNLDATVSDVNYQIDFASPSFTVTLDLYVAGGFRLSGGAVYSPDDIVLAGELVNSVDINGVSYLASEVGTLTGTVITNELSPYAGIGFGNPGWSRFGFFLDLGVAFHGVPGFALTADGPAAILLQFQADLEAERQSIEEDLSNVPVYPVGKIGFSIGF